MANKIHKYNTNLMKFRDSRIKLVHEVTTLVRLFRTHTNGDHTAYLKGNPSCLFSLQVMTNIRSVKIFNWEEKFIEKIAAIRDKEVAMLRKIAYLDAM